MSATKTQAFILKTQDYRDTSLLGDFYTRDFGKIKGILRGVRDARGRYGSTLEPFSLNEILFYRRKRGGDLHQVTQADLLKMFEKLRGDLERLATASYLTELLNEMTDLEDPNPGIFDLFHDSLLFLQSGASPRRSARIFEIKLLELLGLVPEIRSCVRCGQKAPDAAYFSSVQGGILCGKCHGSLTRAASGSRGLPSDSAISVSKGALNFLEHVRRSAVADLYSVKVSQAVGEEIERILRHFVDYHLTHKLKSVVFMEKMGFN